MVEPTEHRTGLITEANRSGIVRRDPLSTYRAWAVNPDNQDETADIFKFLKSKTEEPDKIHQYKLRGRVIGWSHLAIPDAEKANIEAHPGIKKPIIQNSRIDPDLVVPGLEKTTSTRSMYASFGKTTTKRKRAVKWEKQENAVKDLRMVSQPK